MTDYSIPQHVTGLYLFAVVNLLIMLNVNLVKGEVQIINTSTNVTIETYEDFESAFGGGLSDAGILGLLVYANPRNACLSIKPPPRTNLSNVKWIALIARGSCDFSQKVLNAQNASFALAIVHNYVGREDFFPMPRGRHADKVNIPSVFVGWTAGQELAKHDYKNRDIRIHVDSMVPDFNYREYLWPFAIVVATCFCLMVAFMCVKLWRDRRRRMRSRLSAKHLKKIPIKKFKKGDHYDVCAVCLDEYEEGEKLRVLPCSHAYHSKCIDPWLTKNKKTCPVCKRRVIPGEEDNSDTDSDAENGNTSDERTPLLSGTRTGSQASNSSAGTFFRQPELPPPPPSPPVAAAAVEEKGGEEETLEGAVGGEVVVDSLEEDYETAQSGEVNPGFHGDKEVPAAAPPLVENQSKKDSNQVV